MVPALNRMDARSASRASSGLALFMAAITAGLLLTPRPLADVFFAGWVGLAVGLTVLGVAAAWTDRTPLLWVAGIALTTLAALGMWSLGILVAPAALLLLVSAGLSQWARSDRPTTDPQTPPSVFEAVVKTLVGSVAVLAGGLLGHQGVVVRGLFSRGCARETLECAIAVTRWDAVGLTLLAVLGISAGGWLVWRQLTVGGLLTEKRAG